jgi:PAT family beta-lactamase induction signal transducer AmpG
MPSPAHPEVESAAPRERPWLFNFLIAPDAVISLGLIGGALSFLLRKQGVNPATAASIVALLSLPHTIYFLWGPLTDFWLARRTWLLLTAFASAVVMLFAFRQPALSTGWAVALIFLSACLGNCVAAACGGLMGMLGSERNRRLAGSFYQSGSLAFGGAAVFALVALSARVSLHGLGWIVAAMIALPGLAALAAPRNPVTAAQTTRATAARATAARIAREFRSTFLRWQAVPYTALILSPLSSGAMIGLLPELARDYGVSGAQVAWMNGLGGALLMAAGAVAATLIPVRVRGRYAYVGVGLTNAATLAVLAVGPLQPAVYFAGTVLFLFTIGMGYAVFTGVALEFLGDSGKSGSARYAIINSLGNLPVAYMSWVDGRGYAHWGPRAMPGIDAAVTASVATLLLAWFLLSRGNSPGHAE